MTYDPLSPPSHTRLSELQKNIKLLSILLPAPPHLPTPSISVYLAAESISYDLPKWKNKQMKNRIGGGGFQNIYQISVCFPKKHPIYITWDFWNITAEKKTVKGNSQGNWSNASSHLTAMDIWCTILYPPSQQINIGLQLTWIYSPTKKEFGFQILCWEFLYFNPPSMN